MAVFGMRADSELRGVLRSYATQLVTHKYPNCVFREGQKPHGFYLVLRGSLRLYMEPMPGRKIAERIAGEGCVVGLPATVSGDAYSLTCEVADGEVELAYVSQRDFSRLMTSEKIAAMKLLLLLSSEVRAARVEIGRASRATPHSATLRN